MKAFIYFLKYMFTKLYIYKYKCYKKSVKWMFLFTCQDAFKLGVCF